MKFIIESSFKKTFHFQNPKNNFSIRKIDFVYIIFVVNIEVHVKYKWRRRDKIWNKVGLIRKKKRKR